MKWEINEYDLPVLIKGNVIVEWVNLNEGYSGEYDIFDPDDRNLLRFDISKMEDGIKEIVSDASYCTLIEADTPEKIKKKALEVIMMYVYDRVESGESIKKLCEWLSWINEYELTGKETENGKLQT